MICKNSSELSSYVELQGLEILTSYLAIIHPAISANKVSVASRDRASTNHELTPRCRLTGSSQEGDVITLERSLRLDVEEAGQPSFSRADVSLIL